MKEESISPLAALSEGLADAVERIEPSVVRIRGGRRWPASGLVYAEDLVLTTAHALEREEDLTVDTPEGKSLPATFAGRDTRNDLAVLKVEGLEAATATPAGSEARVGGITLAVGRPSRRSVRVCMGVVSAAGSGHRSGGKGHGYRGSTPERYLQTDAAPYPGLGGGALVDTSGEVIGVITAGSNGATLAVPSGLAWEVAGTLAKGGTLKRGYLGVYSQPVRLPGGHGAGLTQELTQERGLLVVGVGEHSPASQAGLMVGDILATLDGQPVEDTEDLLTLLGPAQVGRDVRIQLMRGGALTNLEVTVGERD